jgi:hypothetical protein
MVLGLFMMHCPVIHLNRLSNMSCHVMSSCSFGRVNLRIAVTESQGQFGNPEEGEHLLLEVITRGLVKTHLTTIVNCGVCEIVTALKLSSYQSEP